MKKIWNIGLAVSGGADSTALAVVLAGMQQKLGFRAVVLHVDHGLRPDSAADARFVKRLARELGLPFHGTRVQVVRARGESLEMAARRERLAFFARMVRRLKLDAIATGHHADDVAETFLMRLARGSGAAGLAGLKRISHVNGITFIRPLLDLRDAELRDFLRRQNIAWREDATNTDTSILRNKVRHVVLPWLKANFDPRLTEHICKSAAILRGDLPPLAPTSLNAPKAFKALNAPNALKASKALNAPKALNAFKALNAPKALNALNAPKALNALNALKALNLTIVADQGFVRAPQAIGQLPAVACFSRKALAGRTLELRTWRPGDRIAPTGMDGRSRKIQDVFVTAKTPPEIRRALPLLADAQTGEILWVPGYRVAQGVAVESSDAPSWRMTLAPQVR